MPYFITLLLLLAVLLPRLALAGENATLTDREAALVAQGEPVSMAAMYDFVPFSYIEEGELRGFVPDLVTLIEQKTGLKIELSTGEWSNNLRMLEERQIDAISDISFKPERTPFTLYTTPYFEIPTVVFTRKEFGDYQGLADLSGKRVGVLRNIFYARELRAQNDLEIREYDDYASLVRALAYGEVDAAIQNLTSGYHYASTNAYTNIKVAGEFQLRNVGREDLRFGVQPEKPLLRSIIQKGLDAITEADWETLIDRWVGRASLGFIRQARTVALTPEEREFVKQNPVIRVHNESNFEPYNFFENGRPRGHSMDLIKLLAEKAGLEVNFVSGASWDEYLQMMREGRLDVMMNIVRSDARETYLEFTRPYVRLAQALYRHEGTLPIESFDQLKQKTLVLPDGFYMFDQLSRIPGMKVVPSADSLDALMQISTGEADATIELMTVADHLSQKYGVPNLESQSTLSIGGGEPLSLRIAVREEQPLLRDILQKAMDSLTEEEKRALQQKWLASARSPANYVHLRGEELEWLESRTAVKICVQRNNMPLEKTGDEGRVIGAFADMLEILRNNSGIDFRVEPVDNYLQAIAGLKGGRCDLVATSPLLNRLEGLSFTQPLFTLPLVVATGPDEVFVSDLAQVDGRTLAVVENGEVQEFLRDLEEPVQLQPYPTLEAALTALNDGEVFGVADSLPVLGRELSRRVYGDLKISGQLNNRYALRMAMRAEDAVLSRIMNKTLASLADDQREQIASRWLQLTPVAETTDYRLLAQTSLGAAMLLGVILVWNRKLARLNNRIRESNEQLQQAHEELTVKNRMLEQLSVTDRLTRLKNRLYIEQVFEREIENAEGSGSGFSVLLIDIDHFKEVNDRFGHEVGDALLTDFAALLDLNCRDGDTLARWGGEEFMVICPKTDLKEAEQLAQRLCDEVRAHAFPTAGKRTISIGLACWQAGDRQKSLSMRADEALYRAKEGGRDRVCVETG
ncbi:transporter substrate-binding domain-containing diguanylate cyclase [Marinobacterium sp. YM272]|uniref:transporter substrate-binding domain-containing diguanylate cyclase n=1 Tax=Marinobacterium sp. YM272 TaxID=3421654 RepID=UPI003D7F1C7D